MQLLYCYIKRYVTKLMRFMLLKCVTVGILKPITNVSYRPECGVYFSQACLSIGNVNLTMCDVNSLYAIADCVGLCNTRRAC